MHIKGRVEFTNNHQGQAVKSYEVNIGKILNLKNLCIRLPV